MEPGPEEGLVWWCGSHLACCFLARRTTKHLRNQSLPAALPRFGLPCLDRLQILGEQHAELFQLLGKTSGRDVDKMVGGRPHCAALCHAGPGRAALGCAALLHALLLRQQAWWAVAIVGYRGQRRVSCANPKPPQTTSTTRPLQARLAELGVATREWAAVPTLADCCGVMELEFAAEPFNAGEEGPLWWDSVSNPPARCVVWRGEPSP